MKQCGLVACTGARGLLISSISRHSSVATGSVSALFSSDSLVLSELWEGILTVLLTTFEALAVVLLLFYFVGLATLGGLAVVIVAFIVIQLATRNMEKHNDARSHFTSLRTRDTLEMLLGMKMVKLRGLEAKFERRILDQRELESDCTLRARGWLALTNVFSACSVDAISLAIIGIYTQFSPCDPTVIFTYWVLLGQLYGCTCVLPIALHQVKLGLTAARRIQAEVSRTANIVGSCSEPLTGADVSPVSVDITSASFSWPDCPPLLGDISLSVPAGGMMGIAGPVGSGKTSLLCSLLGELQLKGEMSFSGSKTRPSIGYVPQQAWILPTSARCNIVMGRPWDPERYEAVVQACALEADFAQWPRGDLTDIGSFTISGGQKQRLSLARAGYGKEALYLLDDCLSALDQTVGRHVLENLLLGLLKDSTRIVITSSRAVLERCTNFGLMVPASTLTPSNSFAYSSSFTAATATSIEEGARVPLISTIEENTLMSPSGNDTPVNANLASNINNNNNNNKKSKRGFTLLSFGNFDDLFNEPLGNAILTEPVVPPAEAAPVPSYDSLVEATSSDAEEFQVLLGKGGIASKLTVFRSWALGLNGLLCAGLLVGLITLEVAVVEGGVVWMQYWSAALPAAGSFENNKWLLIYAVFVLAEWTLRFVRIIFLFTFTVQAGDKLHAQLLHVLAKAPMSVFDSKSTGELYVWFGPYLSQLDLHSALTSEVLCVQLGYLFQIMIFNAVVSPWCLLVSAISGVMFVFLLQDKKPVLETAATSTATDNDFFAPLTASFPRKSVDLDKAARSCRTSVAQLRSHEHRLQTPVLVTFSQFLEGLSSIRAFGMTDRFLQLHHHLTDRHVKAWRTASRGEQTQVFVSNLVGVFAYAATVFLIVPLRLLANMDASEAGFLIINACFSSYFVLNAVIELGRLRALTLTRSLLLDPIQSLPEEEDVAAGEAPPSSWPSQGQLELHDVWARYAPQLPPVLCGITLCVRPGEKIGVVGRTGSGKSSLLSAIARTIVPFKGRLVIDGIDLSRVPLADLRSRGVAVVTQDPLLFAGSLRRNLDPFSEYSEAELIEVLTRVKMMEFAKHTLADDTAAAEQGPLDFAVAERGNNLSAGQKQLLAIAQAILRKPRVLLFDEATAALDRASEAAVEATIQTEFKGVTMVLVAHRLSSVLNADRVLVMQDGHIGELGPPSQLLQNPEGLLSKLVQAQNSAAQ